MKFEDLYTMNFEEAVEFLERLKKLSEFLHAERDKETGTELTFLSDETKSGKQFNHFMNGLMSCVDNTIKEMNEDLAVYNWKRKEAE